MPDAGLRGNVRAPRTLAEYHRLLVIYGSCQGDGEPLTFRIWTLTRDNSLSEPLGSTFAVWSRAWPTFYGNLGADRPRTQVVNFPEPVRLQEGRHYAIVVESLNLHHGMLSYLEAGQPNFVAR